MRSCVLSTATSPDEGAENRLLTAPTSKVPKAQLAQFGCVVRRVRPPQCSSPAAALQLQRRLRQSAAACTIRCTSVRRRIEGCSVAMARSRSRTGLLQDKSRTLRPVEWTGSTAISARWRSVHFWTARCDFPRSQAISTLTRTLPANDTLPKHSHSRPRQEHGTMTAGRERAGPLAGRSRLALRAPGSAGCRELR
jgi:hypothetical protein